jgi:hypothetical protein
MIGIQSKSIIFGRLRFIFILSLFIAFITSSCGPKIFPSGLEGNLSGNQKEFARNEKKRKRIAKRANRRTARLEKKAKAPSVKKKKESIKTEEKQRQAHINKQTPEVQERMKQNLKEDNKRNKPNKTFWQRLMFWKKSKCSNGS